MDEEASVRHLVQRGEGAEEDGYAAVVEKTAKQEVLRRMLCEVMCEADTEHRVDLRRASSRGYKGLG
jgi:hypothetical protein